MLRRAFAVLAIVAVSFGLTACADVTGPETTPAQSCGVYVGTGTCA